MRLFLKEYGEVLLAFVSAAISTVIILFILTVLAFLSNKIFDSLM